MASASIERCLEHGSWQPAVGTAALRDLSSTLVSRTSKYLCGERKKEGISLQRQNWVGHSQSCAREVFDPLSLWPHFRNVSFSQAPVHIAFLGDSVGLQTYSALTAAVESNTHLRSHVRFAERTGYCKLVCNLATIPRTAHGCRTLLNTIEWPTRQRGSRAGHTPTHATSHTPRARRFLLAGAGMWYNLKTYCNGTGGSLFGHTPGSPCQHTVLGHHIKPEDLELDHDQPLKANPKQFWRQYHRHFGVPPWGWYSWGRRLQGTATISEYGADVATFLDAATEWARNSSATLVWLEATPQHFGKGACQQQPATPMEPGPWPRTLDVLCAAPTTAPASAAASSAPASEAMRTECIGDWRNHIVRPLLRARGVPFVPLAAGLSTRADLHTGGKGDCTHFCEGTEASLFMATSVLNTIAGLLTKSQLSEL